MGVLDGSVRQRRAWLPAAVAAAVVVALLTALVVVAVQQSTAAVSGQVHARNQDAVRSSRAFVQARMDVLGGAVGMYAARADVRRTLAAVTTTSHAPTALTPALEDLSGALPGLVAAWASDENGVIVDSTAPGRLTNGQDLSERDWFRGARGVATPYLSSGYVNKDAARTPGFAISVAVRSPDSTGVVGVVGVSMSLAALEQVLADAVPAGGRLQVTDQKGQLLAAPGATAEPLADRSQDPGVQTGLLGRTSSQGRDGWEDMNAPLSQGWTVSTGLPASLATGPNSRLTRTLSGGGIAVGLLLLGALLLLARVLRQRGQAQDGLRAALAEVQARRRYTDSVLDTLDVSVAVCDEQGRLTYFNRLARLWHGVDADAEVDPAQWSQAYVTTHPDGTAVAADEWPLVRALTSAEPASGEFSLTGPDGVARRVVVRAQPLLDEDGVGLGVVSGSYDVTRLRENEAQLALARDTALAATQAKSSFLAAVSHEIRTPLNGVLGMLELAMLDDDLTGGHRQRLQVAADSGRTLLRLLNDVLDLSRADAGRLVLSERAVDLPDLLSAATAVVSGSAQRKRLRLDLHIAPQVPERVVVDPDRLTQVLLNLLGNAVKFTDTGSVILRAHAEPDGRGGCVLVLQVADTGPGMTDAECARVFQPFEQGSAGRANGGSGLGLALTSQVLDLLGGDITVDSSVGHGTTFTVRLPVASSGGSTAAADHRRPEASVVRATPRLDLHVLLAEDNEVNQLVVTGLLESRGARVTVVDDGAKAVTEVLAGDYDAVLLDWQMPVMDGPDAARALRAAGLTLPVIGLTARTAAEDVALCLAVGMDAVLPKPFPLEQLEQVLREAVAARSAPGGATAPVVPAAVVR